MGTYGKWAGRQKPRTYFPFNDPKAGWAGCAKDLPFAMSGLGLGHPRPPEALLRTGSVFVSSASWAALEGALQGRGALDVGGPIDPHSVFLGSKLFLTHIVTLDMDRSIARTCTEGHSCQIFSRGRGEDTSVPERSRTLSELPDALRRPRRPRHPAEPPDLRDARCIPPRVDLRPGFKSGLSLYRRNVQTQANKWFGDDVFRTFVHSVASASYLFHPSSTIPPVGGHARPECISVWLRLTVLRNS
eukprot:8571140-Pyramimonas_sp.AAC.1